MRIWVKPMGIWQLMMLKIVIMIVILTVIMMVISYN
jgi:hypothetical protein